MLMEVEAGQSRRILTAADARGREGRDVARRSGRARKIAGRLWGKSRQRSGGDAIGKEFGNGGYLRFGRQHAAGSEGEVQQQRGGPGGHAAAQFEASLFRASIGGHGASLDQGPLVERQPTKCGEKRPALISTHRRPGCATSPAPANTTPSACSTNYPSAIPRPVLSAPYSSTVSQHLVRMTSFRSVH